MRTSRRLKDRRALLAHGGLLALWAGGGLWPAGASAATSTATKTDDQAFAASSLQEALRGLGEVLAAGPAVTLAVPEVAENGAIVPVSVASALPGTQAISLIVEFNPQPLVVQFLFPDQTEAFVATRIKMAASGRVFAVVKAQNKLYAAYRDTRVVLGGCG